MQEPFHFADRIPAPAEITDDLAFPQSNSAEFIRSEWAGQLPRLDALITELDPLQTIWAGATIPSIREASDLVKPVIIPHLLAQLGKGGSRRHRRFSHCFRIIGTFPTTDCFRSTRNIGRRAGRIRPGSTRLAVFFCGRGRPAPRGKL